MPADFHDLPTLFRLRRLVADADPAAPPGIWLASGDLPRPPHRLGLLAGSFNPPHAAHLELAQAALATGLDAVLLVLSKRTVDKEEVSGLALEDRLLLLRLLTVGEPRVGVALVNRGLYVDQAAIVRSACPDLDRLEIVLGHDKIVQVFDPRYYDDRDAALDALFARADALVAPREGAGRAEIDALLTQPENRRYREHVHYLPLPAAYAALSSSALRRRLARDERDSRDALPLVREFVVETGAFAPPARLSDGEVVDAYLLRLALVDAFERAGEWSKAHGDLRRLAMAARRDDALGRELRAWLRSTRTGSPAANLAAFQARAR